MRKNDELFRLQKQNGQPNYLFFAFKSTNATRDFGDGLLLGKSLRGFNLCNLLFLHNSRFLSSLILAKILSISNHI